MKLSLQSAQRIVVEIGNIVGQNINMMDETGRIIASTDPARIGMHHESAAQIIDKQLPELYITQQESSDTQRAGLNLPIVHQGQIVGVIGITGDYKQVIGYGQIVKKMTEILIRESVEQDEKRLDLRVRNHFLEDWVLTGAAHQGLAREFVERGTALGIDIELPRRVMVVSVLNPNQCMSTTAGQKMIENVETAVADLVEREHENLTLRNTGRQILLLHACSDQQMEQFAMRLCNMAKDVFGVRLVVGIDAIDSDIHKAYLKADKAWRSARLSTSGVCAYSQVTLDLFVSEVSRQTKEEFILKVFSGCNYKELCNWISILDAYFAAEGSIASASSMLYMHKNTLQYKLKKLQELTGYDVRYPSHVPIFYMSLQFYKEVADDLSALLD